MLCALELRQLQTLRTSCRLRGTAREGLSSLLEGADPDAAIAIAGISGAGKFGPRSARGLFDVRAPNSAHPPIDDVVAVMRRSCSEGCDRSEIAQDLLRANGGRGRIIRYEPRRGATLRTPEAGGSRIEDYLYHEVFTDGRYIYDARFGTTPVPKADYDRMIRGLNPGVRGG